MAARGLVEEDGQAHGGRLALAHAAKEKVLCDAAIEHGINQQNVAAFQASLRFAGRRSGTACERNFAARAAGEFDIADVFADKVERDWNAKVANEVGGENEGSIHSYDYMQF